MARKLVLNLGNAISLNGSTQNISLPVGSAANLAGYTAVTVMARFKASSVLALGSQYFIFVASVNGSTAARFTLDFQGTKLRLGARANDAAGFLSSTTNEPVAENNSWVHIAGSLDTTTDIVKLYKNGYLLKSDGTQTFAAFTNSNSNAIRIGSAANDVNYLPGLLDDFRIYNTALSEADVLAVSQGNTITTAPVLHQKFESLNGTTLTDEISSSNNGTIINSPTLVAGFSESRTTI